ncbi:MAG: pro-sigmaK processing inhibitor BofA [Clostridium sp.]|nr:pro-sigmaK processing inhibitor BofA [Clostridium sp.]
MAKEYQVILMYIVGILFLYILGKSLASPIKLIPKTILKSVLGAVILLIINFVGNFLNYNLPLNPITAFTAGVLGIPGILLIAILKQILRI